MNNIDFINLYTRQTLDETITPFQNETGFSLIRLYPKGTPYFQDNRRMFIKVALLKDGLYYSVDMTEPRKEVEGETTEYIIKDGEEYKNKITNFYSNDSEFSFDLPSKKFVHQPSGKGFSLNEFVEILVANHLSDRLFFKRMLNELVNGILKIFFWLSDTHYERVQTMIDKYHYDKGENPPPKDDKKNIEPFFKYFYISKNILFAILLITFPSALFLGHLWKAGEFSLSNPTLVLLLFLALFLCEKISIWLDKKIKEFVMQSRDIFTEKKVNFMEKLHDFQYKNNFQLKLNLKHKYPSR